MAGSEGGKPTYYVDDTLSHHLALAAAGLNVSLAPKSPKPSLSYVFEHLILWSCVYLKLSFSLSPQASALFVSACRWHIAQKCNLPVSPQSRVLAP